MSAIEQDCRRNRERSIGSSRDSALVPTKRSCPSSYCLAWEDQERHLARRIRSGVVFRTLTPPTPDRPDRPETSDMDIMDDSFRVAHQPSTRRQNLLHTKKNSTNGLLVHVAARVPTAMILSFKMKVPHVDIASNTTLELCSSHLYSDRVVKGPGFRN